MQGTKELIRFLGYRRAIGVAAKVTGSDRPLWDGSGGSLDSVGQQQASDGTLYGRSDPKLGI
jgi:hypothetical protein